MSNLYTSIEDLPMWNWNKIHEKKDYTFLRVNRINGQCSKYNHALLKKTWEKIFEEYIEEFGFSGQFLAIMEKRKQIAFYQLEFIETGDFSIQTLIEVSEKELAQMMVKDEKNSLWKTKSVIEKLIGFQLDAKKITVVEFYSHISTLKKDGKLS